MSESNAALVTPVTPDVLDPAPHPPLAGNHADDDGRALDEFFEGGPWAPVESEGLAIREEATPRANRLVGMARQLIPVAPQMKAEFFLPADLNRKHLTITTQTAEMGLMVIGSAAFTLPVLDPTVTHPAQQGMFAQGHYCVIIGTLTSPQSVTLDDYTGAVWIAFINEEGQAVNVSVGAITS